MGVFICKVCGAETKEVRCKPKSCACGGQETFVKKEQAEAAKKADAEKK
ncbi:MAG TPA: hypothetical protein VGK74_21960 [Symbiobacteriaceae bacterium]|jgi:hypothetical protein